MKKINGMIMQYFEWYLDNECDLWNKLKQESENLANLGVTAVWMPPAYKAMGGINDVGYGVYDVYDLGEFNQKGSIRTKYGKKDDYLECIVKLQQSGIEAYVDVVLNHKMGADKAQIIHASKCAWENHNQQIGTGETVKVGTKFTFPGRNQKYSDFEWNWTHFTGVDYNEKNGEKAILKFKDKQWGEEVDEEFGNFDYLMGADLDFSNPEVVEECKKWGKWYLELTNANGVRLDAVKHISADFYEKWIKYIREAVGKTIFAVGEYWSYDIAKLHRYIQNTSGEISLFDVPLHGNFYQASINPNFNMAEILKGTLMQENSLKAVTFVDNHDTQPGQALQSYVQLWFREIAYAIILLREEGYPCVFYGDYYGIPHDNIAPLENLKMIMKIRKEFAYGKQNSYFDHQHIIGWTREGDYEHIKSGIAVLISNQEAGEKRMYIGKHFVGEQFLDALNNIEDIITIDEEGFGTFFVKERSVSIWIRK